MASKRDTDALFDGEMLAVEKLTRESDIQKACVRWARESCEAYARKFASPGNRSVPDYIFLRGGDTLYVEFKAPRKKPTEAQQNEHALIRAAGGTVYVIDNIAEFKRRFNEFFFLC